MKELDYQVQVRVLECRQLAGTQLDPVCTVTVGNQKKHTPVKEQTNCPYWDEVHDYGAPYIFIMFEVKFQIQLFNVLYIATECSCTFIDGFVYLFLFLVLRF